VPGAEERTSVRAETLLVQERCGEVVPGLERATVNTRDLVVRERVALILGHEPLHAEEVQVPLVGVARQGTDLKTRRSSPSAVALAVGGSARAADTGDGQGASRLALGELTLDLVDMGLDDGVVGASRMCVVVGAMLKSYGELKNRQHGDEHSHHAGWLAEVGHGEEGRVLFWGFGEGPEGSRVWKKTTQEAEEGRTIKTDAKERNDLWIKPEGL
jgi:hypothetical protein